VNEIKSSPDQSPASPEEMNSALFANMVVQQTNMALMFLGQVPHPESGERVLDLEAAKMFIDALEMFEAKTKGNLDKREETLLKRNLTALRMAFVEASSQKGQPAAKQEPASSSPSETPGGAPGEGVAASSSPTSEAESRKKFSKKY